MNGAERASYPSGSALSRALKRDLGITTGLTYKVRNGIKGITEPSLAVDGGFAATEAGDLRRATEIAAELGGLGYEVRQTESILYVGKIPSKALVAELRRKQNAGEMD